jgi:hypothetical protein
MTRSLFKLRCKALAIFSRNQLRNPSRRTGRSVRNHFNPAVRSTGGLDDTRILSGPLWWRAATCLSGIRMFLAGDFSFDRRQLETALLGNHLGSYLALGMASWSARPRRYQINQI